jgi:hypothetical protein
MRCLGILVALAAAACDGLPLSTTAQAAVVTSPPVYGFGAAMVDSEVGPRTVTVAPTTGEQVDTILGITSCPDFRVDTRGAALPLEVTRACDGDSCDRAEVRDQVFDVFFRPSFAGEQTCVITFDMQGPTADITIAMSGTGLGAPFDIALNQPTTPTIDLGDVPVAATSSAIPVAVRNAGVDPAMPLTITGATATTGFVLVAPPALPAVLAPNAALGLDIACTPAAAGPTTGTLSITSNDPEEPSIDLPLACNGITSPIGVAPGPVVLPGTEVGTPSMVTVTLTNAGATDATISSVTIEGGAGLSILGTPPTAITGAGGTATVDVGFTPVAAGDTVGALVIAFDDGTGPQTRRANVIGRGREAVLSLTPTGPVDLGPTCAGTTRAASFIALNSGSQALSLDMVTLVGPDFAVVPGTPATYPAALPPRGEARATFDVTVTPTATMQTAINAIVTLQATPAVQTRILNVTALAVPTGDYAITDAVDAGAARVGDRGGPRPVALAHCDTATPLTVLALTVDGPDAADFVIDAMPPAPFEVAAGSTATWSVELVPLTPGRKQATLRTVTSSRGELVTELTGEGLDPSGITVPGEDRGSYYACAATGGAGGLAIVGLALGLALAARRRRP